MKTQPNFCPICGHEIEEDRVVCEKDKAEYYDEMSLHYSVAEEANRGYPLEHQDSLDEEEIPERTT